jgi:hypothetical protein
MKKILSIAAIGALFAAMSVQAQTQIYVCGSTAFRANAYRSIRAMFDGGAPTSQNTSGSANNSGAGQMTFSGTITNLYGSNTVTIYCDWTGSAQGVHSLTASPGDSLPFLANASPQGDTTISNHVADLAFSDVFQATTGFNSPTLSDEQVAVQPFCWVANPSVPNSVTNITIQQLRYALGGSCPLSYLTGSTNASDYTNIVYLTGRNKDSGSRLIALSDALYTGSVKVYSNFLGTAVQMTANQIVNGVNYGPGFASGGTEANNLSQTGPYMIGYLGYSDARTVVNAGGHLLTYNGGLPFNGWAGSTNGFDVPDFSPVTTGKYSLWGPEHLFINPSGANYANAYPVFTNLVGYINTDVTNTAFGFTTAIQIGALGNTTRTADGGKIAP